MAPALFRDLCPVLADAPSGEPRSNPRVGLPPRFSKEMEALRGRINTCPRQTARSGGVVLQSLGCLSVCLCETEKPVRKDVLWGHFSSALSSQGHAAKVL